VKVPSDRRDKIFWISNVRNTTGPPNLYNIRFFARELDLMLRRSFGIDKYSTYASVLALPILLATTTTTTSLLLFDGWNRATTATTTTTTISARGRRTIPAAISVSSTTTATSTTNSVVHKMIDAHLHVWGSSSSSSSTTSFPWVQEPPPLHLRDGADVTSLLRYMELSHIDGALIVQPIHYLYDHSYVLQQALQQYPTKFKGMMLYDPTVADVTLAQQRLDELVRAGFVGVRFNPYLWKKQSDAAQPPHPQQPQPQLKWTPMSEGISLEVYRRCGTLQIPVGIMCFQGLSLHYNDIVQLLELSPETIMILDHLAFTKIGDEHDDGSSTTTTITTSAFQQLLQLSKYPTVHVKISALFRLEDDPSGTYTQIYQQRFLPLLQAYGAQRLMYGSDFPYVTEKDPNAYRKMCQLVATWCPDTESKNAIMGGTAERLFGAWG
jgi:predicted TIM-barrel fold metal-dependent hydrolase